MKPFATRTKEEMAELLLHPKANGPEVFYYMIRGGVEKRNITVWEPGTIRGEYIKSFGHYHTGDLAETYTILEGEGIVLLQVRKKDSNGNPIDDELESFTAIKVKTGDKIFIPSGSGHLALNTGTTWLVTSDDSPVNFNDADPVSLPGHADYDTVKKMKGFGYYIIEENGQPKPIPNTNYKNLPEVIWQTASANNGE